MADECTHAAAVRDVVPRSLGCEECLRSGSVWVHLRLCRSCGHESARIGSLRGPKHPDYSVVVIREPAADRSNAADLVRRFADAWAHPQVERFVSMLAADVVLTQPVTPTIRGRAAAREEFSRLLAWLPDLAGTVDRWGAEGDTVLIAWRLRFALGRGPYELRIVDRIVHRDGLIAEREAYFDSLRFLLAALGRPSAWLGYLRYRGYVPARARADAEAGQRPADGSARRT